MGSYLSQFDFTIRNCKGSLNVVADALSRSVAEVSVFDILTFTSDKWYTSMMKKVQDDPESYPTFTVENGILYKHVFPHHDIVSNLANWKIIVPSPNRSEIFKLYHDHPTRGHFGVSKTLSHISGQVCVNQYIFTLGNVSNLPCAGLMGSYKNINFPFQLISADLLGNYPRSENGNKYLLVC